MKRIFFQLIIIVMAAAAFQNLCTSVSSVLFTNLWIRAEWCGKDLVRDAKLLVKNKDVAGLKQFAEDLINPGRCSVKRPASRYFEALAMLAQKDLSVKKRSLVFIPRKQDFWGDSCSIGLCIFVPLYVPAVSGIALLNGMPAPPCDLRWTLGYLSEYPPHHLLKNDDKTICAEASAKGFEEIFVIEDSINGNLSVRNVGCAKGVDS